MRRVAFLIACLAAASAPLLRPAPGAMVASEEGFPGWPAALDGEPLVRIASEARERAFFGVFGGKVARFRAGSREVVVRWIPRPTRRLHPARDCFRSSGWEVAEQQIHRDAQGRAWASFEARRAGVRLRVRERFTDREGSSFADVSTWYWQAETGRSRGPWWALTVAERLPAE